MIAFICSHCGKTLQVQDQFAGRQTKCPTCKQPLVVPTASVTVPSVPPQLARQPSSLARAGINGGVTLSYQDTHSPAAGPRPAEPATGDLDDFDAVLPRSPGFRPRAATHSTETYCA